MAGFCSLVILETDGSAFQVVALGTAEPLTAPFAPSQEEKPYGLVITALSKDLAVLCWRESTLGKYHTQTACPMAFECWSSRVLLGVAEIYYLIPNVTGKCRLWTRNNGFDHQEAQTVTTGVQSGTISVARIGMAGDSAVNGGVGSLGAVVCYQDFNNNIGM